MTDRDKALDASIVDRLRRNEGEIPPRKVVRLTPRADDPGPARPGLEPERDEDDDRVLRWSRGVLVYLLVLCLALGVLWLAFGRG